MKDLIKIQELLKEKADCQARLNLMPYDGSPEIKSQNEKKYLYVRKRVAGKLTSTYVNEGFFIEGGRVRNVPVTTGGSSYVPPIPIESVVKENIERIVLSEKEPIDIAIELCLYCMKTQIFIDNKTISQEYYRIAKNIFGALSEKMIISVLIRLE